MICVIESHITAYIVSTNNIVISDADGVHPANIVR